MIIKIINNTLKGFTLLLVKYVLYYDLLIAYSHDVQQKLTDYYYYYYYYFFFPLSEKLKILDNKH